MSESRIKQLDAWSLGDDMAIRQIIRTVCDKNGALTPRQLFQLNPELGRELFEQIADIIDETEEVGDFERNLEREVF